MLLRATLPSGREVNYKHPFGPQTMATKLKMGQPTFAMESEGEAEVELNGAVEHQRGGKLL